MLFDIDGRGRIARLNEPDPERAAPSFFLARGRASRLVLFGADVPEAIAIELAALAAELGPWDGRATDGGSLDLLRRALGARPGGAEESHGPAFRFPRSLAPDAGSKTILVDETNAHLLAANFPYTRSVLGARSPVAAIVRDGMVVSASYSARRRPTAAEAGLDTVEPYRGQGLAVAAVSAWAVAARSAGLTPLYSTSWDNSASLRVAAKLGLEAYADSVSFG